MAGNADALGNVASQYQAIHNLVTGALHVSEQSAAAQVGWTGLAADDYDTMRCGSGRFSNGTYLGGQVLENYLDQQLAAGTLTVQSAQSAEVVMTQLAMLLEEAVGWFNTQAHLVDESNSFLHSVLFQIIIAVVALIVAIAAAYVAPFILAGLGAVAGFIGDAAVSALSIAARGVTTVMASADGAAATEVAASTAADAGASAATEAGAGATTDTVVSPGAVTATETGAGATTDAVVSPGAVTATETGAGATTDAVVSPGAATTTNTGAGATAETGSTSGYGTASETSGTSGYGTASETSGTSGYSTASETSGTSGYSTASETSGTSGYSTASETGSTSGYSTASETGSTSGYSTASGGGEIQPAPLENVSANGSADNSAAGSQQVSSEIQPAPLAAEPANGGAGAATPGADGPAAVPALTWPSKQEIGHGLAMVLTQSGTDAAGQTLVQMVQSGIEHHGQFWKLSKDQGLFIAGSALGIPLAQAFNLALRSGLPLLGRTLVDGGLNWKLPAGLKFPSSLAGKPGINIWFTYGNAGVAAYGLDQQFTHQKFSIVAALISYGGYGVLATSDAALGKLLPGLFSRTGRGRADGQPNWVNRPPLTPGQYRNGKVPDTYWTQRPRGYQGPLNANGHFPGGPPKLGGRGTGGQTGRVSGGPAGHGWSVDPRPYIQQTIPKIANRLWYYALDHQLIYDNGHLPGVQDGNKHYYFVHPTMDPQPPPTTGSAVGGPTGGVSQPAVGAVPSAPTPAVPGGGGQPTSPGHPAPQTQPQPGAQPGSSSQPTPAQITASYAQDQQALQAAQTALNQQIAQIQQLRSTLGHLPQTQPVKDIEEELIALQTTITAQQGEITRTQQLIGQLQSHSGSQESTLLVGPAAIAVQQHIDEVNSREDTIGSLITTDTAKVDSARRSAHGLPRVPVVSR